MMTMRNLRAAVLSISLAASCGVAQAQDLRIGFKAQVDSSDPHQLYTPNRNVQLLVYEPLVAQDAHLRLLPALAESWRHLDDTTWEFKLRDVRFQDGSPFTAADVIFSIRRAQATEGVRTYRIYARDVAAMEAKDAHTLIIHTPRAAPLLPTNLAAFGIVSAHAAEGATDADFNGGRAAVGTGPYRWVKLTPGAQVELARNPDYWGGVEPWAHVYYRFVANDSARAAALLAGDLDVIDTVPPSLYDRIRGSGRTTLITETSNFTLYFALDQFRDRSPFVTDLAGKPLDRNPLRDVRVRQAMSLALNRVAIAERAMEGGAEPAAQFEPEGFDGYDPKLPPPPADPARGRRLLAEAGYPEGFGLTIHCTSDRYAGDARVCQTIAQMLTSIGIKTQVDALPAAVFFRRAGNAASEPEFSAQMSIFSSLSSIGLENMNSLVRTASASLGFGASNRGRYSNPALDRALELAETTFDDALREQRVREATEMVIADQGVIPVFYWKGSWGLRKGLTLQPRGDQYTYPTGIRAAK
jgi:peptide/nickel transport system substrate-binding protein